MGVKMNKQIIKKELVFSDLKKFVPSLKIAENVFTIPMLIDQEHPLYNLEINDELSDE